MINLGKIILCETGIGKIREINLENYCDSYINISSNYNLGPVALDYNKKYIVTCNKYNDSISIYERENKKNSIIYIGKNPCDVAIFMDKAYVICSESNTVNVVNLINKELMYTIKVGECPYNIKINEGKFLGYILNLFGDSIDIIDCTSDVLIDKITGIKSPIKCIISEDMKYLYVLEGNLNEDDTGNLLFISLKDNSIFKRIKIGKMPLDLAQNNNHIFVSNSGEGTISIIHKSTGNELFKINVGGMIKEILEYKGTLYANNYLDDSIYEINLQKKFIKKVASGKDPNAIKIS